MFAPKVAKPQTKATEGSTSRLVPHRSMVVGDRPGRDPLDQVQFLQRTIGNQATLRLLAQRARSPTEKGVEGHNKQEADPAPLTTRGETPGPSRNFSKIPLFPPDRTSRPQPSSTLAATPRSGVIQAKLVVGQVNDPLEHEADRVAGQVMRMQITGLSIGRGAPRITRKCGANAMPATMTKSAPDALPVMMIQKRSRFSRSRLVRSALQAARLLVSWMMPFGLPGGRSMRALAAFSNNASAMISAGCASIPTAPRGNPPLRSVPMPTRRDRISFSPMGGSTRIPSLVESCLHMS